jgi:hypothetical protein
MEVRNCFQFENNFFEMQFLLELVLTSFESTLSYFNNDGEPVFFGETRSKKQLADLKDIFNGIIDYAKDTKLQAGDLSAEDFTVFDSVLSLIKTKYSVINTDYFSNVKMQDPFNNREFEYQL